MSIILTSCVDNYNKKEIYQSDLFTVLPDRILQGEYEAKALSNIEIISNYGSEVNSKLSPRINFKFSINGKDNELPSGSHHSLVVLPNDAEGKSTTVKFGRPYQDETGIPEGMFLAKNTKIHIKLDLRSVLDAFDKGGYYTNFNGLKIYKEDFDKVYIAGNVEPLVWDFDNLVNHPELEMKDPDGDGIYEITLNLNTREPKTDQNTWKLSEDVSKYPSYKSPYLMMDALYNLSLEELVKNVETDSTFRTGKEWDGVWTRDVSYSTILSLAILEPDVAKNSLLKKVKNQRIIQDTGTGGAYPISTDRVVWAIAAWEIYKVTGDESWLKEAYTIIKNTLEDDQLNIVDPLVGLMKGESSFLDWRQQTYPKWMQPIDIYESFALSTNVVHYQAQRVLAAMAQQLQDKQTAEQYTSFADSLKKNINKHFWLEKSGYYGQYIYGGVYKTLSERSDALGEALSVLFDVADEEQQANIITRTPVVNYGISCVYPQTTFIPAYHNNAIWPFVQSYWTMASAKVANEKATVASLAALMRPAALFLTNKENFRADNGDYARTQVNSDEMLWSLSGNLAVIYKVFFGMQFDTEGIHFKPHVPKVLRGERKLENFKYRNALLDITISGHGNAITSISVDGNEQEEAYIPGNIEGKHQVLIVLSDNQLPEGNVNLVPNSFAIDMPALRYENGKLKWRIVEGAKNYKVLKNGAATTLVENFEVDILQNEFAEYQVIAIDSSGTESFASRPYTILSPGLQQLIELEDFVKPSTKKLSGYSGKGFVETSVSVNDSIVIPVNIQDEGLYAIDFRYANGNGPVNTENKCAIRSLEWNDRLLGSVVFPQRGKDEWSDWGYTNKIITTLEKGEHQIKLLLRRPVNDNMNGTVNQALLDHIRILKIK